MKKISPPQLVILLDVLFIFLFILILKETPPKTKIILPETQLEPGGFLSLEYEKGKRAFFRPGFPGWSSSENGGIIHNNVGKFAIEIDCNKECLDKIKSRYDLRQYKHRDDIKIVVTNEVLDNISRITYLACQTDSDSCGNIVFYINENWELDKEKLWAKNPFLKGIEGIEKNL